MSPVESTESIYQQNAENSVFIQRRAGEVGRLNLEDVLNANTKKQFVFHLLPLFEKVMWTDVDFASLVRTILKLLFVAFAQVSSWLITIYHYSLKASQIGWHVVFFFSSFYAFFFSFKFICAYALTNRLVISLSFARALYANKIQNVCVCVVCVQHLVPAFCVIVTCTTNPIVCST